MSGDNQQGQHGPFSKDGEQGQKGKKNGKVPYPRDKEYKIHDEDEGETV